MIFKNNNNIIDIEISIIPEILMFLDGLYQCKKLQNCRRSCKHNDFPPNDYSMSPGTKMVKISQRMEAKVLYLNGHEAKIEALTLKRGIYRLSWA